MRKLFTRQQINQYLATIEVKATFTETSTGVIRKKEATSPRLQWYSQTMSFLGLSDKFKPGLPFKFKVS